MAPLGCALVGPNEIIMPNKAGKIRAGINQWSKVIQKAGVLKVSMGGYMRESFSMDWPLGGNESYGDKY